MQGITPERLNPHVLYIGGEDHDFRIPFMHRLRQHGFRVSAAGTGDPGPFEKAGIEFHSFRFQRYVDPLADLAAIRSLRRLMRRVRPEIAQTCDTKPGFLVPLAGRGVPGVRVVRTVNGRGWLYSSRAPLALMLRPIYRGVHCLAARSVAATVFEIHDDKFFFDRHGMTGQQRGRVIPGAGLDVQGFEQSLADAPSPTDLRFELGLGDAEVVMTVTRNRLAKRASQRSLRRPPLYTRSVPRRDSCWLDHARVRGDWRSLKRRSMPTPLMSWRLAHGRMWRRSCALPTYLRFHRNIVRACRVCSARRPWRACRW